MKTKMKDVNSRVSLMNLRILVVELPFVQSKGIKEVLRLVKDKEFQGVFFYSPVYARQIKFYKLTQLYDASIEGVMLVVANRRYDLRGNTIFFFDADKELASRKYVA